jgi:putative SOS response-associated peptidase YedK
MCGRFTHFADSTELARLFGCGFELPLQPRNNVAPGQEVPVVRLVEDQPETRQVALLRWGLVPSWASDPKICLQCINAPLRNRRQQARVPGGLSPAALPHPD